MFNIAANATHHNTHQGYIGAEKEIFRRPIYTMFHSLPVRFSQQVSNMLDREDMKAIIRRDFATRFPFVETIILLGNYGHNQTDIATRN